MVGSQEGMIKPKWLLVCCIDSMMRLYVKQNSSPRYLEKDTQLGELSDDHQREMATHGTDDKYNYLK